MASHKRNEQYAERFEQVFGDKPLRHDASPDGSARVRTAAGGTAEEFARPSLDRAAGGFFLTAEEVVHDLLNLGNIRDPGRWLKRHKAPVALAAGGAKRYLAAHILRWAATRFCPNEQGRSTLLAIAESSEKSPFGVGPNDMTDDSRRPPTSESKGPA